MGWVANVIMMADRVADVRVGPPTELGRIPELIVDSPQEGPSEPSHSNMAAKVSAMGSKTLLAEPKLPKGLDQRLTSPTQTHT